MTTKESPVMCRWLRSALTVAGALAAGVALCDCGPTFRLRPAPAVPPMLPAAPSIPSSQSTESDQAPTDGVHRATARPMSDLRAQTLAVAVEGDASVTEGFARMLPRVFVAARALHAGALPGHDPEPHRQRRPHHGRRPHVALRGAVASAPRPIGQ